MTQTTEHLNKNKIQTITERAHVLADLVGIKLNISSSDSMPELDDLGKIRRLIQQKTTMRFSLMRFLQLKDAEYQNAKKILILSNENERLEGLVQRKDDIIGGYMNMIQQSLSDENIAS